VDAGPDRSVSTPIFTTSSDTCADAPAVSSAIKQPPSSDSWIALGMTFSPGLFFRSRRPRMRQCNAGPHVMAIINREMKFGIRDWPHVNWRIATLLATRPPRWANSVIV
jgi:hypothetical protein